MDRQRIIARDEARDDALTFLRHAARSLEGMPRQDRTGELECLIGQIMYLWKGVRDLNVSWEENEIMKPRRAARKATVRRQADNQTGGK